MSIFVWTVISVCHLLIHSWPSPSDSSSRNVFLTLFCLFFCSTFNPTSFSAYKKRRACRCEMLVYFVDCCQSKQANIALVLTLFFIFCFNRFNLIALLSCTLLQWLHNFLLNWLRRTRKWQLSLPSLHEWFHHHWTLSFQLTTWTALEKLVVVLEAVRSPQLTAAAVWAPLARAPPDTAATMSLPFVHGPCCPLR